MKLLPIGLPAYYSCTKYTGMTSFCQKCNQPGHVSSVGVPSSLNILFSWSSTSLPGKSGRPALASSAKMQPADHMSIDVV